MKGPNSSFAIAVGISLAVHAGLVLVLLRFEPSPAGDAWRRRDAEIPVILEPQAQMEAPQVRPPDEFAMGDEAGKGDASHDLPAPSEAIAPEADSDQAFLSLDPPGTGDSGSDAAVAKADGAGSVRGEPGGGPARPVPETDEPPTPTPVALFDTDVEPKRPRVRSTPPQSLIAVGTEREAELALPTSQPAPPIAQPEPVAVAVATAAPQPQPTTIAPRGSAAVGGTQQPAADPARMSDSESDPFSRLGTVTFSEGALQIRFGRKVKTRKPKLLIAGQLDLITLQRAKVVLDIHIDETGKVTHVAVSKSSGSNEIDQPTRVAVYDWWFEPKKDPGGTAVPDQVQFTVGWR